MIHKNTSGLPILYFGTPVAIISTVNDDGSENVAPISSIFWLGWRCIIGIDASSRTTVNLLHSRQCVDQDRIDPNKWKPLIMSFQNLFTLSTQVAPSVLASIPEQLYKSNTIKTTGS